MQKDFDRWNGRKIKINAQVLRPHFHEREIWFCYLGLNVGSEQDGGDIDFQRPVIIYKKFNNEIFWAVPLSRSRKSDKFHFNFRFEINDSSALLSQIRLIDGKRLSRKIGDISKNDFDQLNKRLKMLLP